MYTLSKKPQNICQIFLSSLNFWRQYYCQMLIAMLITVLFGTLPGLILPRMEHITREMTFHFIITNWYFYLAYVIIMLFLFGFVVHRVYSLMYQTHATTCDSFCAVLKKLPYLIVALVIYDIVIFLGVVAFLIPGIGLMVLLSMYFIVIIVEGANPIQGFKRSWLMITDNWWHTFAVLFILTIGTYLISYIIGQLSVDLWVVIHPIGRGHLGLGNRICRIIADLILLPYFISTLMVLYQDLKIRKQESIDNA